MVGKASMPTTVKITPPVLDEDKVVKRLPDVFDDVVVGDDATVRDRKRAEVYARWCELAKDDDFVGVQNYERNWYDGSGAVDEHGQIGRAHV